MERSRSGVRLSAGLGSRRLSPRPHGLQRFPDSRAQARGSLGCLRSIPGWVRTPALCRVFAHMPASSLRCPALPRSSFSHPIRPVKGHPGLSPGSVPAAAVLAGPALCCWEVETPCRPESQERWAAVCTPGHVGASWGLRHLGYRRMCPVIGRQAAQMGTAPSSPRKGCGCSGGPGKGSFRSEIL